MALEHTQPHPRSPRCLTQPGIILSQDIGIVAVRIPLHIPHRTAVHGTEIKKALGEIPFEGKANVTR